MNIIQIGCNDCNDEVFKFVVNNANKINNFVAIDALSKATDIARNKYSFLGDKLTVINCAVGLKSGLLFFYHPQNDDVSGHASLSLDHLRGHSHKVINRITVPTIEINTLLSDIVEKIGQINRFYIDTEGFDVPLLMQLDIDKYKIDYIEFEYVHSDGVHKTGENLNKLLEKLKINYNSLNKSGEYNMIAQSLK